MVLNIKQLRRIALILTGIALAVSCEEYFGPSVDCSECWADKPDSMELVIYVTIDHNHTMVPLVVYEGNMEDNRVFRIDTAYESTVYVPAALDRLYSVTAEYRVGDKTIYAVDGDEMKAKHVSDQCETDCWIVKGGYLKAELKFD